MWVSISLCGAVLRLRDRSAYGDAPRVGRHLARRAIPGSVSYASPAASGDLRGIPALAARPAARGSVRRAGAVGRSAPVRHSRLFLLLHVPALPRDAGHCRPCRSLIACCTASCCCGRPHLSWFDLHNIDSGELLIPHAMLMLCSDQINVNEVDHMFNNLYNYCDNCQVPLTSFTLCAYYSDWKFSAKPLLIQLHITRILHIFWTSFDIELCLASMIIVVNFYFLKPKHREIKIS